MPPTKTQVNSATGIMGPTGVGKSSLAYTLALYLWTKYKKVLLYYSSDGGGFPALVQKGQSMGIIRVFRMYTREGADSSLSEETCYRSAQGWWPRRINPRTGEVAPGVEMVPPMALQFEMKCKQGHLVKSVPSQALLIPAMCPTCRTMVTKAEMQVTKTLKQNKGFEDVGGVFYDGLTSMLAWIMRDLGHRAGRMELKGEEGAIGGKVVSGDLKFGGSTRSHVGFAQARGEELVHLTLGIHNLMVPPVFTMLTHEDVDERSLSIRGPKIAGRAKTDEAPQWFGNMIEAAKIPTPNAAGEQRVLYLNEFTDALGIRHLCKHRGAPGTMPAMLSDPPEDPEHPELAFTQFNLGVFFEMLDAALEQEIAKGMIEVPDAPGMPEGLVEYGDMTISAPLPEVAGATAPAVQSGPATLQGPTTGAPAAPAAPAAPRTRGGKKAAVAAIPPAAAPPAAPAVPATTVQALGEALVQAGTQIELPTGPAAPIVGPQVATTPAGAPAPAPAATQTVAAPITAPAAPRPMAAPPGARPMSAGGTPGGASVSGPSAPRPTAAVPRAPAAAPRPPVAAKPA